MTKRLLKFRKFVSNNPLLMKLYRNVGILFGGNATSAFLGLLALSVLTRALDPKTFGLYAILTAFVSLIDRFASFQTWQALIHFGAHAKQEKAHDRLSSLLVFGWLLDLASGLAAAIFAFLAARYFPKIFGLELAPIETIYMVSLVLVLNWMATPTAILRLFNRFSHQAAYLNIGAGLRVIGYFSLWASENTSLEAYFFIWGLSTIAGRLYLFGMAYIVATKNGLMRRSHIDIHRMLKETPGLWRFVLTTNADGIVRVLREADVFVINHVLGTEGVGLYKVARDLARIPTQLTGPFNQAIYPDLSKLVARRRYQDFKKLMLQSSFTLGIIISLGWCLFSVFGQWAIGLAFGAHYEASYSVAFWCIGAFSVWAFAQPLSPGMLALGKAGVSLGIHIVTSLFYISTLYFFLIAFALRGAGFALFAFYVFWSFCMFIFFRKNLKGAMRNEK